MLRNEQPDPSPSEALEAALHPIALASEDVLVPGKRGRWIGRTQVEMVQTEVLVVLDDLDLGAPRILDERQLEEPVNLPNVL